MARIFVSILVSHLVCSQICLNYFLDDCHFVHKIVLSFPETNESDLRCQEENKMSAILIASQNK